MQIRANQLARRLQSPDWPTAFFVAGDEQLLVEEACDAIIAAAKTRDFSERTLFEAAPRAPWRELFQGAANLSLFASKRVLDVRIPPRGVDRAGSDALRNYLKAPLDDTLLLCRAVGLEWRHRSSAWYKALEKAGLLVSVWPVTAAELPRWLEGRCRAVGLELTPDAIEALAERVEGNLLAARQEIEKLKLLASSTSIGVSEVAEAVGDSTHFDVFALIDAALAGHGAKSRKMLHALRLEGVAVFQIMGAVVNQLRRARELAAGGNPRLSNTRRRLVGAAVQRLGAARLGELAGECALLDLQAKGMLNGDAWQSLERILLAVAGTMPPALAAEARMWRA